MARKKARALLTRFALGAAAWTGLAFACQDARRDECHQFCEQLGTSGNGSCNNTCERGDANQTLGSCTIGDLSCPGSMMCAAATSSCAPGGTPSDFAQLSWTVSDAQGEGILGGDGTSERVIICIGDLPNGSTWRRGRYEQRVDDSFCSSQPFAPNLGGCFSSDSQTYVTAGGSEETCKL